MMCLNGLQWGLSSSCLPSSIDGMVVDLCGPYTVCFLCPPEKKNIDVPVMASSSRYWNMLIVLS